MLSAPKWCFGLNRDGSSKLATVRSIFSLPSLNWKPNEVPHVLQNGRRAIGELSYQSGSVAQLTSAALTFLNAIETDPVERWHIRQWHRYASSLSTFAV